MLAIAAVATLIACGALVHEIVTACHDHQRWEREQAQRRLMDEIGRQP